MQDCEKCELRGGGPAPGRLRERVLYERQVRGLSQKAAAKLIGIEATMLHRVEVGSGRRRASDLVRVLDYYELPLELLRTLED